MLFGNDEDVMWRNGTNIFEGDQMFVFVDLVAWNGSGDNFAEDAIVFHICPLVILNQ